MLEAFEGATAASCLETSNRLGSILFIAALSTLATTYQGDHGVLKKNIGRQDRRTVFAGSSTEGISILEAVQLNLERAVEVVPWTSIFKPAHFTLQALERAIPDFDAALFLLTPDDVVRSRGEEQLAPRDNILVEAGISIGSLGSERTFLLVDRSVETKVPSDFAGVTVVSYVPPSRGNWEAALGPPCIRIKNAVESLT